MIVLVDQRCLNHALREAVAQCPSCKRFFCRECVTEHSGRMICVNCVNVLTRDGPDTEKRTRLRWTVTALAGLVITWLVFYYLGLTLARIPSQFHEVSRAPARLPSQVPELSCILWGRRFRLSTPS